MTSEVSFGELQKNSDMLPPPAYSITPSRKTKAAKIIGVTAIIISIIVAITVLLGLYFTRNNIKQEKINFIILNDNNEIPINADVNYNDKFEKLTISNGDLITVKDYNRALAAFVNKSDDGDCFIRELPKSDVDAFKTKKIFRNNEVYSSLKGDEVIFTKIPTPVHHEVVRYAAGMHIAEFCRGKSVFWLIAKDETSKFRRQTPTLTYDANRDSVQCLYANGYGPFQTPQVFYQCNVFKNVV